MKNFLYKILFFLIFTIFSAQTVFSLQCKNLFHETQNTTINTFQPFGSGSLFTELITSLKNAFSANTPLTSDSISQLRKKLFHLESYARFLADEEIEFITTKIEDSFGDYKLTFDMAKIWEEGFFSEKFDDTEKTKIRDQLYIEMNNKINKLKLILDEKWLTGENVVRLEELFSSYQWDNYSLFKNELINYLLKIINKIKIEKDALSNAKNFKDFKKKLDSLHSSRRKIRWLLLIIQSFPGIFQLDDNIVTPSLSQYLEDETLLNSPFTQLKPSQVDQPLLIPKEIFLALSAYVDRLGTAKDYGEQVEYFTSIIFNAGVISDKEEAYLFALDYVSHLPTYVNIQIVARQIKDEMKSTNLIQQLLTYLSAQITTN